MTNYFTLICFAGILKVWLTVNDGEKAGKIVLIPLLKK